jgi:c-di-GMP-binding flagellar brake protein YcgR
MQQGFEFPIHGLQVGQRIEIGVGEDDLEWLASRIEDHDEAGQYLTIAWPTDHERRRIPLKPGDHLQLAASTPQDALYSTAAAVHEITREPVPFVVLQVTGTWQRSQRRSAVRVSVAVRPRIASRLAGNTQKPLRLGVTNISAGGVQVRSQDELRLGDRLLLAFELMGMDQEIEVEACVRRVYRNERGASSVWDAGCEFEGMSGRLVERIVQYIFAQQRALARARRGES